MTLAVSFVLLGWIPFAMLLFAVMPARQAVVWCYLLGWMFLPNAGWDFEGLPDYTKGNAATVAAVLGVLIFDSGRLLTFRPRWIDIPLFVYTIVPLLSCLSNNIGGTTSQALYSGSVLVLDQVQVYCIPWVLGRVYVTKLEHLRDIAVAFVYAGLIYVPLCLLEVRLSPQLHRWIYGFHPGGVRMFAQTIRLGGFRPVVFMQHGLMVGLFLTNAVIVAYTLMRSRALRETWGLPVSFAVVTLAGTALLAKSTGALALLVLGVGMLSLTAFFQARVFLVCLLLLVPVYMYSRAADLWHGEGLVDVVAAIDEARAQSLTFRMDNEDLFLEKARERVWLGWAGWNRWQVTDPDTGELLTVPDGLWVIVLGQFGVVGLFGVFTMLLLPMSLLLWRYRPWDWMTPTLGPAVALSTALVLFAIDSLLNAMLASFYFHAAGATSGALLMSKPVAARRSVAAPANGNDPPPRNALPESMA